VAVLVDEDDVLDFGMCSADPLVAAPGRDLMEEKLVVSHSRSFLGDPPIGAVEA
jgi:hypothetical protein